MKIEQYLKNLTSPSGEVDVVLDTDAYNEIDDQFAISYLLSCPERLHVKGICAAPFLNCKSVSPKDGMEKSYLEILKLLTLAGKEDLKRLLAIYFEQNTTTERFEDYDGQRFMEATG